MKKVNTSPISGMQELLPATQATFDNLKSKISEVYHRHGFLSIETPVIDRAEILFAKAGGDTEKQVYKVVKTAEAADDSDQALRFDHTVPLARYVVEHESNLAFPFKATQIGRNYRGERAQKGRFREFYQCDIDIIGRGSLPIAYDADVLGTLLETYASFELGTPVIARMNNRKIVSGLIAELGLEDKKDVVYSAIDHSEKVSPEETKKYLKDNGVADSKIAKLVAIMNLHGSREFVVKNLRGIKVKNELFNEGLNELETVMSLLEAQGLGDMISADMKIVRGLDYYTGTVFEFCLPEYNKIGSVGGGGRYENLAGHFTDQAFPGVGGSIGLTRLFFILSEYGLVKDSDKKPLDICIIPVSENEIPYSMALAARLRSHNTKVDVILTDKKLGDKMTYAAKVANKGIVVGESEVVSGSLKIKDFSTGEVSNF